MLIVDDDTFELECIKTYIDWELIGVQIVGEAVNGSLGLMKAMELNPDIVLTDVKMPVMDGIEMSRRLRKIAPQIKIIFLSSYDDFEFAKQAINLKASGYITKPVNEVELLKNVKIAADEIIEKALYKEINSRQDKNYKISLTLARQSIVTQVLTGNRINLEEAENMGLGWLFNSSHLCLLLSIYEKENMHLVSEGINLLNQKLDRQYNRSISVCVNEGVLITFVSFSKDIDDSAVEPLKALLQDNLTERGCRDVRVKAIFENGVDINPADQYFKIIQNSANYRYAQAGSVPVERKKLKKEIVQQIEDIINSQYDTPLTIESIARMINFTPNYIGSIFKSEKKISINRFLMNVRLEKAEELLHDEKLLMNDIAARCGYENVTYFYTLFKKERGITPSEYRTKVLAQEN